MIRTTKANRLLHYVIDEVSQHETWDGEPRDKDYWKRLFVAAWARARAKDILIASSVDGCGIDVVYMKTSRLTQDEVSDLTEYILAWAADRGLCIQTGVVA